MLDLHGIEGFVPMIDLEAKGIILVKWLCEKQKRVLLEDGLSASQGEYGMKEDVCVCACTYV